MVKVIITNEEGTVLESFLVSTDYLKGVATYPDYMGAASIREAIEEQFEVTDAN